MLFEDAGADLRKHTACNLRRSRRPPLRLRFRGSIGLDWIQAFFPGSVLAGTRQAGKQAAMAGLGAPGALSLCCPAHRAGPDKQPPNSSLIRKGPIMVVSNRSDVHT